MQVRELLAQAQGHFADLSDKLRAALHNENLADVVKAAADKLQQASEHADADHDVETIQKAADAGVKLERPGAALASGMPEGSNNGVGDASQQGSG